MAGTDSAPNGDSTSLVSTTTKKRAKLGFCRSYLMLPFGKSTFYVPEEAVISVPKGTNRVQNATILNQIIGTKSPSTWFNYLVTTPMPSRDQADGSHVLCFDRRTPTG